MYVNNDNPFQRFERKDYIGDRQPVTINFQHGHMTQAREIPEE